MHDQNQEPLVAIGDLHGCARSLEALLEKLSDYNDRRFIFIGDYIDRGPDSRRVLELLLDFQQEHSAIFLRGNHEQMLLDAIEENDYRLWMMNGGDTTLASYDTDYPNPSIPHSHMEFYRQTRLYYETEDYFYVHAGLPPEMTIEEAKQSDQASYYFLWERSHLQVPETPWEKTVVFGHTPQAQPIIRSDRLGIDTGCVFKSLGYGTLTAALLPETEFITQKCLE